MILLSLLLGCGSPAGAPCDLSEPGPLGFGFADACRSECLANTDVTCPDGRALKPGVCAGAADCAPGGCPVGQACYAVPDPFEEQTLCVPVDVCDAGLDVAAWEEQSRQAAQRLREEQANRGPAKKVAAEPVDASAETSTLVVRHGDGVAVLGCVTDGVLTTGADCRPGVPAGTEVGLAGERLRLGPPASVACGVGEALVPGWSAEVVGTDEAARRSWAWIPGTPSPFARPHASQRSGLPQAILQKLPPQTERQIALAASVDIDGNGQSDELLRVFYPVDDPDKPGRTVLWWLDGSPTGRLLPTDGVDLNGVQDVAGVMPLRTGSLLLLHSQWAGGQGLHLVGPRPGGGVGGLYEVVCGS